MDIGFNMRQVQVIFLAIFAIVFITFLATVSMPAIKTAGLLYEPTVGYFSNVKEMPKETSEDSIPEKIAEEKGVPEENIEKLEILTETEFVTAAADVNVTQCMNLTTSNRIYQLNQSIGGNQSFWVEIDWKMYPCINIKADNIVLDCDGYSITGSSSEDIGIYAQGRKNITLENCTIDSYDKGIYLTDTNNSNFKNNAIDGIFAFDGIELNISNNNYFFNNTIDVMHFGVSVYDSNNTTFRNTTINNAGRGFFVGAPEYALGDTGKLYSVDVDNETNFIDGLPIQFFDGVHKACPNNEVLSYLYNYSLIAFYGCDNITFGQTAATDGIYFWMTPNSYIWFVDSSNSEYGLYIVYSDNVTVKDSLFWMDNYGIFSHLSNNLSIEENTINDSYFTGINLVLADSSYLFNNSLNSLDSLYGIDIEASNDVKLRNNSVIKAPRRSGIQVGGSPTMRNDVDTTNTVDGFPVKYIDGLHVACPNNSVVSYPDSYSMIGFVDCVNVTLNFTLAEDSIYFYHMKDSSIINSEVFNSSSGVYIMNANNVSVANSIFENNGENFFSYDSSGVNILGNNITGGEGIFSINLSNSVIEQNIINCSIYYSGIYFIDSDSNNITGNQIGNGSYGIYLDGSNNNKLVNNFVTNNDDNDFYSNRSSNNVIINLTTTDTSSDFTYAGELELTHADDITPPTNYGDINHFLNISGDRWIFINVSYKNADVPFGTNISTLKIWKYSSGGWSNLVGSVNGINEAGKYVYANITNFSSTFAPLGNGTAQCDLICDSESCIENNDTPGVIICLNASINAALTIAADNQTLDCNGYSLTGTGSDYGVNVSRKVNVTVKNCDIHSFDYCISFYRTNYSHVIDNNIDNCTTLGIVVSGVASGYNNIVRNTVNNSNVGLMVTISDYDNLTNNTIVNSNQNDLDLSDAPGLLAVNQVLNDTSISLTLDGDVALDWEPSSSAPTGYSIIGHALDITKNSGSLWLYLNVSYSDSDIAGIAESSLRLWKNSSGEWNQKLNESSTLVSGVNIASNYVYANISNFSSVYAPFGISSVISSCQNITTYSGTYVLNTSISGNQSHGPCIDVQLENVTIDCNDYSINGSDLSDSYGVYANNVNNIIVTNCNLRDYYFGVYFKVSNNSIIMNNTANSNDGGLRAEYSNNLVIVSNNLTNNTNSGIKLENSLNSNLTSNTIINNSVGIRFSNSQNSVIVLNTIKNNTNYGINLDSSPNSTLTSNTLSYNTYGIYLDGNHNTTLLSNNATSNFEYGIWASSDNSTFNLNIANNNGKSGLFIDGGDNCALSNNTANSNSEYGISLQTSENNTFIDNAAANNTLWDIYSPSSGYKNNTFIRQTIGNGSYQILSNFTYKDGISLKGVNSPPNDISGYKNISKYVNATNQTTAAWLALNISYTNSDISGVDESLLIILKHNGSWQTDAATFSNNHGVNTASNYVYTNITNFGSIFAPMAITPISITVVSPLNRSYNNQTLWFNITTNYNAFTCKINLDGHGNVTMQNSSLKNWYNQTTGLSETLHNVTYWCNDTTGLTSDQKIIYFTVDLTKPYINVTAPREGETLNLSSAIYVNATVNEDASACKASFDNSTNITLTNSSNKRNWTGSDNLANGNHDVIVYCSDLAGNWNVSKKVSFVVYIPPEEEGVGGGTGGAPTQNATSITLVWPAIAGNGSHSMSTPVDSIDIIAVIISVKSQLKAGGLLQILQYNNRTAATIDAPGNFYKYFYFSATNIPYSNINNATIKFRVLKSWLNTSNVDSDTIKMYRFTSIWNALDTVKTGGDSKYFYYDAYTTAFSYFAITGSAVSGGANVTEQPNVTTPTVVTQPTTGPISACGNGICGVGEDSTNCPVDCGAPPSMAIEAPVMILIGVIIAAVISVVAVFLLVVKPRMEAKQFEMGGPAMAGLPQVPGIEMEQRPSFIEVEMPPAKEHELEGYVRRNLVRGITPQQIDAVLDKVGWKTEQIKNAFDLATTPPEKEEDLIGYVVRMEAKGFTPQQIRARLIQAGWKQTEVFHVMKMAAERMRGR